ncbi:MAG: Rieske 2Fe-2S domain-containing protein [Gammaproteobacteria bacterium]|nr:Rieske 2Fe-2S domain-containing protein [Gammaproteobacteria bacterium]
MDTHKISAVSAAADWDYLIQEGRVHRSVYTSEALFRREMRNIFARTWVFVGHESEIPAPGDFVTRHFGGRPVIITRDRDAAIHVLFNRCAHRGAKVCREDKGSCKVFVCPYHSWSYDHAGRSVSVPLDYAYDADRESGKFDLVRAPRVSAYRGFIFACLNPGQPALEEHLSGARKVIDDWLDRYGGGEVQVSGTQRYRIAANWKFVTDNQGDGYHPAYSHRSLLMMAASRYGDKDMQYFAADPDKSDMFVKAFRNGHYYLDQRPEMHKVSAWEQQRPQPGREHLERSLPEKYGATEAKRLLELAVGAGLNLTVFPNLLLIGNQVQLVDPLGVDQTDLYWFATTVSNLPDEVNAMRMRTQEDFPMFGEVDDVENFESCQTGLGIPEAEWVDCSRHLHSEREVAEIDGTRAPVTSDITMRTFYREWKRLMSLDAGSDQRRENL